MSPLDIICEVVADTPIPEGAVMRVVVEDVTLADAPSRPIAESCQVVTPGGPRAVALHIADFDPKARYTVRVHIDAEGDGRLAVGDLVSTQSHPVLTHGYPNKVRVPVHPV